MARKRIRLSRRMLFTWGILLGFIFLFSPQTVTNKIQFAFTHIFKWPLHVGRTISLSVGTRQPLTDAVSSKNYNRLQNHLANLEAQLNQEHRKVEKLAGLRDREVWKGARFVLADVMTTSVSGAKGEIIINRGENDGLANGQFVLGDNSIIGVISGVSDRMARIKITTDPSFRIAVEIENLKLKVPCLMQGNGNNSAKIRMLSIKYNVRPGCKVYAAKKPGFLDAPMIVGKITKCKRAAENALLWDIQVEPVCDIESIKSIAVIVMNPAK